MKKNILILGGDERQLYMAECFFNNGFDTEIFGFSEKEGGKVRKSEGLTDAIDKADIIVVPMPVSRDGVNLNAPFNSEIISMEEIYKAFKNSNRKKRVYGGFLGKSDIKEFSNAFVYDYSVSETLVLKNAALTAEGTIGMMVSSSSLGVYDSDVLICGYGRIGKILAGYVKALGGRAVVAVRKEKDFCMCGLNGIKAIYYCDLKEEASKCDFLINTVPDKIIDKSTVDLLGENCTVIDLASYPGGCDFEAMEKRKIKFFHALGLPGKYSPKTAGRLIYDVITDKEKD